MRELLKKIGGFAKKAFLVIVVYVVVFSLFGFFFNSNKLTHQSTDPIKQNRADLYKKINDPQLNSTKEGKAVTMLYRLTLCGLVGEACTNNPIDANKNFSHSVFGGMTSLLTMPYAYPPASGIYWVHNGLENAGFVPKTYAAQGIGFASLGPVHGLWILFRNFAYLFLVVIIIAIGFMIMFRTKINPQTVISVESALPRIVLALILITFSFAIGGFLIDLMYVTISLTISLVAQAGAIHPIDDLSPMNIPSLQNRFLGAGFNELWPFGGNPFMVGNAMVDLLPNVVQGTFKSFISLVITTVMLKLIITNGMFGVNGILEHTSGIGVGVDALTFGFNGNAGQTPFYPIIALEVFFFGFFYNYAFGFILGVIFSVTLLFYLFRIFFVALTSYIKVLLFIIFSPLILLFVAIPGRKAFSWWFKNLLAELVTFPIIITLLLVGFVITYGPLSAGNTFRAPFLNGLDPQALSVLLGMGLTLMTPGLIKACKKALGAQGLGGLGAGTFFAGVGALGGGASGLMQKYYYAQATGVAGLVKKAFGRGAKEAPRVKDTHDTLTQAPQ